MDQDVTRLVLNRETLAFEVGILADFEVRKILGKSYPALAAQPNAQVLGVLVQGINPAEQRALSYYEGDEYLIETISVVLSKSQKVLPAKVFCPKGDVKLETDLWNLADWQLTAKAKMLPELRKEMQNYWDTFIRTGHSGLHPSAPSKIRGDVKS